MKIKHLLLFVPAVALSLSLNSCKPEEPTPPPTPEPSPSNVIQSTSISFDENGNPTDTAVSTNTYDGQNRVIKTVSNDGSEVNYTYTATTMTVQSVDPTDPTSSFSLVYTLDAKGRLFSAPLELFGFKIGSIHHEYSADDKLKTIGFYSVQSKDTTKTFYTWINNNNTQQTEDGTTTTFDFDATKRELRNFGTEDIQRSRNRNLITKETETVVGEPEIISTYEYEYDAAGRPVKEIVKQAGLKVSETTYKY